MERYIYKRGSDYYSNPHLLAEASSKSWAGFIGSLVRRELITLEDVGSDGFFKAASLSKVLYFKNNPHLLAALCARQLSERSTLLQRARMLATTNVENISIQTENSSHPFASKLREAASSWLAPRWLAPAGLFTAGVLLGLGLRFLRPEPVSAQTSIPTPTPKTELVPTRTPTRVPATPSPTLSPTPEPTPAPPVLDELIKKRAEAVAIQLPNLEDLTWDAINISAEQLEVSVDSLDPATLRAVNIRVKNIVEGISNLVINGTLQPDQSEKVFEQVLHSKLVQNYLRVTIYGHMADDLKEAESTAKINKADLIVNLLKKTAKNSKNLQHGFIYLMSRSFTAEDLDYAIATVEGWNLIGELDGQTLVDLMAEFHQEVNPDDSIVGRRSLLRALLNKHLTIFDKDIRFLDRLRELITSLV